MSTPRAFIIGLGLVGPAGVNVADTICSLRAGKTCISPLTLFPFAAGEQPPAGQIGCAVPMENGLPRTHVLALIAAREAVGDGEPPDAVVIGTTTGGIPLTEELIKQQVRDPSAYALHGTGTVAELVARSLGCRGPALTVSTACSSGAVALKAALELIRTSRARRVLAGGVDALSRLTFYGFYFLQLIDPQGARPFDKNRLGMTVGEGAGLLLLEAGDVPPPGAIAELLGGGLSCDAYHATKPHPEGTGAILAMQAALTDAGLEPGTIGYINLHGTGTRDNDAAEAGAVRAVFGDHVPPVSSTKGLTGHPLAAAGAMEAGFVCLAIKHGFIPPNVGCGEPDPELGFVPVLEPKDTRLDIALSNSFGFGGNNAALALGRPRPKPCDFTKTPCRLVIQGLACLTGAGHMAETLHTISEGLPCAGKAQLDLVARDLPARQVRRLGRLSQIALALAVAAHQNAAIAQSPTAVFFGTGWGSLSETYDFLIKLYESGEKFSSPTDFVGSVHNAPAGQIALWFKAQGANVTATGGDFSFEQALLMATLCSERGRGPALLIGADEGHAVLTPLFDPSAAHVGHLADGGGALLVSSDPGLQGPILNLAFLEPAGADGLERLFQSLGGPDALMARFGAILVGMPAAQRDTATVQLEHLLARSRFPGPVVDYRHHLGEFASAGAVAAALGVEFVRQGALPAALTGPETLLQGRGILLLGFGATLSAIEILA